MRFLFVINKTRNCLSILLIASIYMNAQNLKLNPFQIEYPKSEWDLRVNGFKIKSNLTLTISQDSFESIRATLTEIPFLFKHNLSEKVSLLGGVKFNFLEHNQTGIQEFGMSASLGLQYDFSENTYFQAVFDYQIKPLDDIYLYNYGNPSSFYIRSGFKF